MSVYTNGPPSVGKFYLSQVSRPEARNFLRLKNFKYGGAA